MASQTSAAPSGAFVELDVDLIDEGRFKSLIQEKLRKAVGGLGEYEQRSGDLTASATVTIKLKVKRQKGSEQFMEITYHGKTEVPVVQSTTTVKRAGDKLLCQPAGSNKGDPDQQLFYDARGRVIGGVDRDTGVKLSAETARAIAGKEAPAGVPN